MKMTLSRDDRQRYQRDIGWEPDGKGGYKQHRFKLGRDRAQAAIRSVKLEQLWDCVQKRWSVTRATPRPVWDALTLHLGMALARGEETAAIVPSEDITDPVYMMLWLEQQQGYYPCIRLTLPPEFEARRQEGLGAVGKIDQTYSQIEAMQETVRAGVEEMRVRFLGKAGAGTQTLHDALRAFEAWAGKNYRDVGEDRPSAFGVVFMKQVALLRDHVSNVPLSRFGLAEIEAMLRHWQGRPMSKKGKPVSRETVKNMIKRIREFVKWLHKSSEFSWRRPEDYEVRPLRIQTTREETAKKGAGADRLYTVEELGTLYEYASPTERIYLLLGMNCGFQQDQVASLQVQQFTEGPHGVYPMSGAWIKKVRHKSQVYGEWKLWSATVAGLKRVRGDRTSGPMVMGSKSRPLTTRTTGGNRNSTIPNAWARLTRRIQKDHPSFPVLSFGAVKDTAVSNIRRLAGGEVAMMFISHGQPTDDPLLELYAARPFTKVFEAIDKWGEELAFMFSKVPDPFPMDAKKSNPSLSLGTIRRIKEMRGQGFKYKKICEELGVAMDTVRRYGKVDQVVPEKTKFRGSEPG